MKILVVSDSHGHNEQVKKAIDAETPDMLIHLGDVCDDLSELESWMHVPEKPCIFVKGNCDGYRPQQKNAAVFGLYGHRFLCVHGHLQGVDYGYDRLLYLADENKCDIVLHGHTHVPHDAEFDGSFGKVRVMNPGSVTNPRGGSSRSYIVINMKEDGEYEAVFKKL